MATAADRGWGSPDEKDYAKNHLALVDAGGIRLTVRTEVRYLVAGLLNDLAPFYKLRKGECWGQINRPIRGYEAKWEATHDLRYKSNHSWGLAIDLNSRSNPLTSDGVLHTDMPVELVRYLCRKWGATWGGDYKGKRRDAMHLEWVIRPEQVKNYPLPVEKIGPPPRVKKLAA